MNKLLFLTFSFTLFTLGKLNAQLSVTADSTNPTCLSSSGAASVIANGGTTYTYKWSNGVTTDNISNVPAGSYTVTVYSVFNGSFIKDTIYKESFDEANPQWNLNIAPAGADNEANNNYWAINDSAGGAPDGQCVKWLSGDKTLFVTSFSGNTKLTTSEKQILTGLGGLPEPGALWDNGATCGLTSYFGFGWCTATDMNAQSANINTANISHPSGTHNLLLSYDFIGGGGDASNVGSSLYSTGGQNGTFTTLDPSLVSSQLCDFSIPGQAAIDGGQGGGVWARRSYNLPSNTYNIGTFVLQFNWTNGDGDANAADPSVAINNILILDSIQIGGNGGIDSIVKTFNLVPVGSATPAIVTAAPTKICASDSSHICVQTSYSHYEWNVTINIPGDTNQCIYARSARDYYATVTDVNGCTATSNHATLSVYPTTSVAVQVLGDTLYCSPQVHYQWFKGATELAGDTSYYYVAKSSGDYAVEVTDTNGCTTFSSLIPLGVQNLTKDVGFDIYPNPATSANVILSVNTQCLGCEINMYDALGRTVFSGKVKSQRQEIDISQLAKGVYVVKLAGGSKQFIKE